MFEKVKRSRDAVDRALLPRSATRSGRKSFITEKLARRLLRKAASESFSALQLKGRLQLHLLATTLAPRARLRPGASPISRTHDTTNIKTQMAEEDRAEEEARRLEKQRLDHHSKCSTTHGPHPNYIRENSNHRVAMDDV
ncbi:uncharacterized protein PITG_08936 [Phytophthora infestans T30-4]|uniref:Uncharacterized protein n=1 Tax=Phytophthora infestans (strain T30-4) TaxID=403677 RepID=D0NDJ4_PHYIT|nr:uncharacterized protein PITG_08936 [Phytophthora infestans T30-4]EEY56151.1 hypothetical protein PITG_08936 [Phytophthora infestans T30-4]|eukprot:XP_002902981.1 hypothetical protein PITG_08936 [Phytophthora infestans T30-4]